MSASGNGVIEFIEGDASLCEYVEQIGVAALDGLAAAIGYEGVGNGRFRGSWFWRWL